MLEYYGDIVIFPIYGRLGAIWKPDLILTFYLTKTERKYL